MKALDWFLLCLFGFYTGVNAAFVLKRVSEGHPWQAGCYGLLCVCLIGASVCVIIRKGGGR